LHQGFAYAKLKEAEMFKTIISILMLTGLFVCVEGQDYWWVKHNDGAGSGDIFRGICALSATDVWVVGEGGAVYHRSGSVHDPTWTKNENFPQGYTNYHFNDICFVDASHGWIVGEKKQQTGDQTSYTGVIYYTADGGTTLWSDQTPNIWPTFPIPTPFRKVKMVPPGPLYHGYISCGNGWVLKTVDGGATWSRTQTDPWSSTDNVSNWYNGLWVNPGNNQQAWVASDAFGIIAKTDDGGNTWTPYQSTAFNYAYSIPGNPQQPPCGTKLAFFDADFSSFTNGAIALSFGRVGTTGNGGTNWTVTAYEEVYWFSGNRTKQGSDLRWKIGCNTPTF
jgi:photosystem II stability/assembly factor-like uncharacterized protein